MLAAAVSAEVNTTVENIGARRLHTVRIPAAALSQRKNALAWCSLTRQAMLLSMLQLMERILEDVSYVAGDSEGDLGPGAECAAPPHGVCPVVPGCARLLLLIGMCRSGPSGECR